MKQRANLRSPIFLQYDAQAPVPAATNLFLRSSEFNTSPNGTQAAITVLSNTVSAPDGTMTAESLTSNTDSPISKFTQQNLSLPTVGQWTFSVYVKYSGVSVISILGATNASPYTNWLRATFNILEGTANQDVGTARIEDVTNGWYRISVSGTSVATGSNLFRISMPNASSSDDGFFVWGGQIEAGAVVTPLINTTSSPAARSATTAYSNDEVTAEVRIWSGSGGYNRDRSNIIRASNDFTDSQWFVSSGVSTEANATTDPFGGSEGHRFTSTVGTNGLNVFGGWQTTERCISIYAKKDTTDTIKLRNGSSATNQVTFDLSKGVITSEGGSAKGHIREVGSGWYRVSMTHTGTGSQTFNLITNVNNKSIFIHGAQVEEGSQATTYIPTTTTGLTVDAYTSDIPTDTTYTLDGSPVNNKTTFEISDLVRDYIVQSKYTNSGAVWLEVKMHDLNQLHKYYTFLCTEGYIGSSEDIQTHLNTSKDPALMQANDTVIKTYSDKTLNIPFYAQEGAAYTLTNASGTESAQRPIGSSDLSGEQIDYLQVEDDTTKVKVYVDSTLIHEIKVQDSECSKFDKNVLLFVNKFGAKQYFAVDMKSVEKIRIKDSGFNRNVIDYSSLSINNGVHGYKRNVTESRETYTLNTPFLDEGNVQAFEELLLSEYVWMSKDGADYLPVTIKDNSMTRKTHVNDKLIQYTVNVESSFNLINNQR